MFVVDFDFFNKLFGFFKKPIASETPSEFPVTFEQAVDLVAHEMDGIDANEDPFFRMSQGMFVRNYLDLWNKEGALSQHMTQRFGLCHADDTSMLITNAACAKINGEPYDIDADIRRCEEHWQRIGLNPATMERLVS